MGSTIRNLIEYQGIDKIRKSDQSCFKAIDFDYSIHIDTRQAEAESIIKVGVVPEVVGYKVVATPQGVSQEGKKNTAYKLVVTGDLKIKIAYIVSESIPSLHTVKATVPFATYVTLPEYFNTHQPIILKTFVEDIYSELLSNRCIYTHIFMWLVAYVD